MKIIVVEDDQANLSLMLRILAHMGHEVLNGQTYQEGLALIEQASVGNLLITDVVFSKNAVPMQKDGIVLARHALERGMKVIVVSGAIHQYSGHEVVSRTALLDIPLISKPFQVDALMAQVDALIRQE